MADSTLDDALFFLFKGRFGAPTKTVKDIPGGVLGADHHDVAAVPDYLKIGDVLEVPLTYGSAEFVYLRYNDAAAPPTMAAKQLAIPVATTWYDYTNDPDNAGAQITEGNPLAVVCLSAMTDTKYGWFYCGGPVPVDFVAGLNGNFATEGAVAIGGICSNDLTADAIGLGPVAADTEFAIGYSYAADAA